MPDECKLGSNASDQCFRTKQSCSKHPVQCQRCAELGSSCTYSFGKFMGRPKKNLKSRRQFQRDARGDSRKLPKTPIQINTSNISTEGPDEAPYPTPRSDPPTKFDGTRTQSLDWWQYSRNEKNTSNYRSGADDVEDHSAKGDESQRTTSKQPTRTSACDQCYRFKVKCTREPDRCQRCTLNSNACTYSATVEMDRSRKRSAPGSPMESSKKRIAFSSQIKPAQNEEDYRTSSTTTDSYGNGSETLCLGASPAMLYPGLTSSVPKDTTTLQPKSPHQKDQILISAPHNSTSRSPYQSSTALHEATGILDDDLSFYESSPYYSNNILPIPPSNYFFESDNPTHDLNFEIGGNENPEQSQGNKLCSEPANLDPALENPVFTSCGCLQSALSILSTLHTIVHRNSASSFDSIFAEARNGLFTREALTLAQCSSCQPGSISTLLMLCVAILQQVYNAYELLANPAKLSTEGGDVTGKKMALSIKIGDMEFADIGNSPSIMNAILKMEKARAERVCVGLKKMATGAQSGDLPAASKEETMVRDGLIGLFGVFRGRFVSEVM